MSKPFVAGLFAGLFVAGLVTSGCSALRAPDKSERPAYRSVRPAVAFEILRDSPRVSVLDLRPEDLFCGVDGHIRWSWNLPLESLESRLEEISFLKPRTFLVYCDSDDCAHRGMEVLVEAGFADAMLIDGGIHAWLSEGFGTVDVPEGAVSPDGLVRGAVGSVQ